MILALISAIDGDDLGWRSFIAAPQVGDTIHIETDEGDARVYIVQQVVHRPGLGPEAPGLEIICGFEGLATI